VGNGKSKSRNGHKMTWGGEMRLWWEGRWAVRLRRGFTVGAAAAHTTRRHRLGAATQVPRRAGRNQLAILPRRVGRNQLAILPRRVGRNQLAILPR
jgi:hypothetical protein